MPIGILVPFVERAILLPLNCFAILSKMTTNSLLLTAELKTKIKTKIN